LILPLLSKIKRNTLRKIKNNLILPLLLYYENTNIGYIPCNQHMIKTIIRIMFLFFIT
jgi:hypothetical protein